ncbi:MAG TPA: redoxin domain-containing protein [Vulgatibacter sp.]|nr:redoxin domain-containing protein [Vulgatibacter sp.]
MRYLLLPVLLALAVPVAAQGDVLDVALEGTDGKAATLRERMGDKPFLLLTFFSASCPCQSLHDPRIRELHERFGDRIEILSIDPEAHSSLARDLEEAKKRGYPFPILSDPDGVVADAVGARFATYTVILDADGEVRYRGGWDTDRTRLTDDARQWVRDAVVRLLAGEEPETRETKAFGCYLRRR